MNLLRGLIYNKEVSLTVADTTELVAEGVRLHGLSPASAYVFGKALSALAFMGSCLKEDVGELSLSLRSNGEGEDIGISVNRALHLRGYIANGQMAGEGNAESERRALGTEGCVTVVRDDGYNRPFVGTCALPEFGGVDEGLEEYFRVSEQLPTRICTSIQKEGGRYAFTGVIALQPLPFASEETLRKVASLHLPALLDEVAKMGIERAVEKHFTDCGEIEKRTARYQCNCSREYLAGVLVTLGEAQIRDVIRTEGAVRVHCHYCNRDYEFTEKDADGLFAKKA